MDCSPPGFTVHGISQTRILKWVAIFFFFSSNPGIDPEPPACLLLGKWIPYHWATWESPYSIIGYYKIMAIIPCAISLLLINFALIFLISL